MRLHNPLAFILPLLATTLSAFHPLEQFRSRCPYRSASSLTPQPPLFGERGSQTDPDPETALDQQPSLRVDILNVQKNKGKIVVALYKDKADWLKNPFRKIMLSTNESLQTALLAVPHGKYAISVYQDINGNGELDQNFLGIPTEPIGFGNNYRPFGKPKFESALTEHNVTPKPEAIKLFSVL